MDCLIDDDRTKEWRTGGMHLYDISSMDSITMTYVSAMLWDEFIEPFDKQKHIQCEQICSIHHGLEIAYKRWLASNSYPVGPLLFDVELRELDDLTFTFATLRAILVDNGCIETTIVIQKIGEDVLLTAETLQL